MSGKVIIEVTRGALAGKKYEYEGVEHIYVGRQDDCGIVLPEKTVSRYHCLLQIAPPDVKLQDFGSLNGTFLNEEKIGQRERTQTWEEGRALRHDEYTIKDGDVLRLGKQCELLCRIEAPELCAVCGAVLPENAVNPISSGTLPDGDAGLYYSPTGERICENCYLEAEKQRLMELLEAQKQAQLEAERKEKERIAREKAEQERIAKEKAKQERLAKEKAAKLAEEQRRKEEENQRKEAERLAREKAEREKKAAEEAAKREEAKRKEAERLQALLEAEKKKQKKCAQCGKTFIPKSSDQTLCPDCVNKRDEAEVILKALLEAMIGGAAQSAEPSPVEGYEKVQRLGRGGMGEVWKVREKKTGKYFALKTMLPQMAVNEQAKTLFLREAKVSEQLDHKNVVRTYKSGCANGVFYILMDLCEGGSVDGLMAKHGGKLCLEQATLIILQVLDGLDYVHNVKVDVDVKKGLFNATKEVEATGLVHRDFKPGNIFLADNTDYPVAKVADFGMAKAFETAGLSKVTKDGSAMGTPQFMPRQQAVNFRYSKPDVDVWAAAASYYNMLTGQFPRDFAPGKNPCMVLMTGSIVPIRQRDQSIPPKLAAVIDRALQEVPEIGYKSAATFRRDIIAALPEQVKKAVLGVLK